MIFGHIGHCDVALAMALIGLVLILIVIWRR